MVEALTHVAALGQDRLAQDRRVAAGDDADRLASGVHLDGGDLDWMHGRLSAVHNGQTQRIMGIVTTITRPSSGSPRRQ